MCNFIWKLKVILFRKIRTKVWQYFYILPSFLQERIILPLTDSLVKTMDFTVDLRYLKSDTNIIIMAIFNLFWRFYFRIRWNSWLPESRGAEKRALWKGCRHLGMRSYPLYLTGGLPTLLGRGSTQALCSDQSWRIRCNF